MVRAGAFGLKAAMPASRAEVAHSDSVGLVMNCGQTRGQFSKEREGSSREEGRKVETAARQGTHLKLTSKLAFLTYAKFSSLSLSLLKRRHYHSDVM